MAPGVRGHSGERLGVHPAVQWLRKGRYCQDRTVKSTSQGNCRQVTAQDWRWVGSGQSVSEKSTQALTLEGASSQ